MGLPFRSRFSFNVDQELLLSLPITPWNFAVSKIGGDIESDAGVRAAFVVCNNEQLVFALRFYEHEWSTIQAFIDFAQSGAQIVWYPDQDVDNGIVCYLDAPAVGSSYEATSDGDYPRVQLLQITLVRPGCIPWSLPPYIDRTEEEVPLPPPPPPGWIIHIFDEAFTDNLVVLSGTGQAYVLIVAGGGSGGSVDGFGVGAGGGGAGEVIIMPDPLHGLDYLTLFPGTYPVVRGPGGNAPHADHTIAGGVFGAVTGVDGEDSSFAGFVAQGGGGGGAADAVLQRRGKNGGSGGGGASAGDSAPGPGAYDGGTSTATDGYGHVGGNGTNSGGGTGAGGGGASNPGSSGIGGAGIEFDISNVEGFMVEYGRGGDARNGGPGRFGTDNTGNGGEGGGQALMSDGADGSSGIIIVKYRRETGIVAIGGTRTEYDDD